MAPPTQGPPSDHGSPDSSPSKPTVSAQDTSSDVGAQVSSSDAPQAYRVIIGGEHSGMRAEPGSSTLSESAAAVDGPHATDSGSTTPRHATDESSSVSASRAAARPDPRAEPAEENPTGRQTAGQSILSGSSLAFGTSARIVAPTGSHGVVPTPEINEPLPRDAASELTIDRNALLTGIALALLLLALAYLGRSAL